MEAKKIVVITTEDVFPNESEHIGNMLDNDVNIIHLRKPTWDKQQMETLIESIDYKYYDRLVIHSHFELCSKYHLKGIHLGKSRMDIPHNVNGSVSYSCHTLDELTRYKHLDYCTLSPIFNSISKQGYQSAFTIDTLREAAKHGLINHKTFALGGITQEQLPLLWEIGFGGACFLGSVWDKL